MKKEDLVNKIDEIAEIIISDINKVEGYSLFSGKLGLFIFLCYYSKYKNTNTYNNITGNVLNQIFNEINETDNLELSLSNGLAGIGWTLDYLEKHNLIEPETEFLNTIDNLIEETLFGHLTAGDYDYLHKGLGIAFYYSERKNSDNKKRLENVVRLLNKSKKINPDTQSVYWLSESIKNGKIAEKSTVNISLSHGLASIVGVLTRLYKINILPPETEKLLRLTIQFILEQEVDFAKYGCCFPNLAIDYCPNNEFSSRLSWCYGDLGIAMSLYNASLVLDDINIKDKATEVLLKNTGRKDLEKNSVQYGGICHGSAGVAHIYNRMYLNTQMPEFKKTADYWFQKTLEFAEWENGLAGYKKQTIYKGKQYLDNNYSFLDGIAGIGLAMISYVSDILPDWDRALLIS